VAGRSKACVCAAARLLGCCGFESRQGHGCGVVSLRRADYSSRGVLSSVASDGEASTLRRPWPTRGFCATRKTTVLSDEHLSVLY
jgi:hypothetical protein